MTIKQITDDVERLKQASDRREHQSIVFYRPGESKEAIEARIAAAPRAEGYGCLVLPEPLPATDEGIEAWERQARAYYQSLTPKRS